ncbi:MAG: aminotransferase class V-fold PLP-dependent enzyme, partial [Thermogutta sp.]
MATKRIYLDNAATTWPKPPAVYEAVDAYQRNLGCSPGRSTYRDAMEADRVVAEARRAVARCLGVSDPHRIVFGFNGTDVLNMAIRGVVRPGDHVVTTAADHNSVL